MTSNFDYLLEISNEVSTILKTFCSKDIAILSFLTPIMVNNTHKVIKSCFTRVLLMKIFMFCVRERVSPIVEIGWRNGR